MYDPAKFREGTSVRIVDRKALKKFRETWTHHHPLTLDQLEYAGRVVVIAASSMYHGGDILYELRGAPGIWHERCLESV